MIRKIKVEKRMKKPGKLIFVIAGIKSCRKISKIQKEEK